MGTPAAQLPPGVRLGLPDFLDDPASELPLDQVHSGQRVWCGRVARVRAIGRQSRAIDVA